MKQLGFKPTKASGAGWIEKEDGENKGALAQLKSTDKNSIKINFQDLVVLEHHANISRKIPVFIVQSLQSDDIYLMVKPYYLQDLVNYVDQGVYEARGEDYISDTTVNTSNSETISSGDREKFWAEMKEGWNLLYDKKNRY